jgi:hypothetical protein
MTPPEKRTYIGLVHGGGFYSSEPFDTLRDRIEAARETITSDSKCPPLIHAEIAWDHEDEITVGRSSFDPAFVIVMQEMPPGFS